MAFQVADDILDYTEDAVGDGEAGRTRPARAQGDAAADRRAAAADAGRPRRASTRSSRTEAPTDELIAEVIGIVAEAGGIDVRAAAGRAVRA